MNKTPWSGKLFGIGLGRTGTQSLAAALRKLGIDTMHYPYSLHDLNLFAASLDITVTKRWRFLDAVFPGSRFLLTTRDEEAWLESCRRHYDQEWRRRPLGQFTTLQLAIAETDFDVYGSWQFDADGFRAAKRRHEAAVREHFKGRPNDLLELDITATPDGELWQKLILFLECPLDPSSWKAPFPWENKSKGADDK